MHEKEHVIRVLEETRKAIDEGNSLKLKELSNQTVHAASTAQDTDSILVAIIVYSLSKIIERENEYNKKECDNFCSFAYNEIGDAIGALKNDDIKAFSKNLNNITKSISKLSKDFRKNMEDVFEKARINKASKIYAHGISMEQTADLLGITLYELANYVGPREDRTISLTKTSPVKDRIKLAMDFFK